MSLLHPRSLGSGTSEDPNNSSTFNDFDDYNGYTKMDTINTIDYKLICTVNYINPDNVDGIVMARTWHKKITIDVTSSLMTDTLRF